MKHTFAFIDKLIILLKFVPQNVDTSEDKDKARKAIVLIEEYTQTLRKLINNHKTEENLRKLHQAPNRSVTSWAQHVAATFKKMESLLDVLYEDAEKLTTILENNPQQWNSKISDMALGMVLSGLHDSEDHVVRLRNIAVFEIHELEAVISDKRHMQGLHFWQTVSHLDQEQQMVEHEKYFVKLLS